MAVLHDTISSFIHSFIPDIYIAPLQETYSEALSVQLRSKRNVLRSLQKEEMLFWGSKRSVRGSSFQVEGPITEKALRCLSAERARGTKSSPRAEERRARREARSETGLQSSVKYDGAQPVIDRQTSAEILYKMRWETGSQCRTSLMNIATNYFLLISIQHCYMLDYFL